MVAQPAIQQGKLLGKNLKRKINNKSMTPFSYFDKGSMATVGRNKAVVEVAGMRFSGWFAWILLMVVAPGLLGRVPQQDGCLGQLDCAILPVQQGGAPDYPPL